MQINDIAHLAAKGGAQKSENGFPVAGPNGSVQHKEVKEAKSTESLRSISLQNPTYNKKEMKETALDRFTEDEASGLSAAEIKEKMVLNAENMTPGEQGSLQKDGYDPMEMDKDDYVTIADKIRVSLAKGGMDISVTGGLSEGKLETLGENSFSVETEGASDRVKEEVLDPEMNKAVDNALKKAEEIHALSEDNMLYLVKNGMEPTIDNLFTAGFSQGSTTAGADYVQKIDLGSFEMKTMLEQVSAVIENAGLSVSEETLKEAELLLNNEIPVTEENLLYFDTLKNGSLQLSSEEVAEAILTAVEEGQNPGNAYLMEGFSLKDQARTAYDVMQSVSPEDVTALVQKERPLTIEELSRQMEENPSENAGGQEAFAGDLSTYSEKEISALRVVQETRLMMTVEANHALLKMGISIDTIALSDLVERLKEQEATESVEEAVGKTLSKTEELKQMPLALLGGFSQPAAIEKATINDLHRAGTTQVARFAAANERYETMQTEVRRDLGDSIQKAFRNVGEILADLGLEETEENARAVRILGYNSMEITTEAIGAMKYADALVQRTFKNMTPAAVTAMIKAGQNPLDMSLSQLNDTAKQFNDNSGSGKQEEKFSEFLWKLEQQKGITEEERQSYIGVFRLIHQVEATDGAVIGQLLQQGADLTLRNMMGAVRTRKNEGRDYRVDDDFGGVNAVSTKLSVTQQIEAAFMTLRMSDAGDAITPDKMMQFENEDAYMNMDPDQFAGALEQMEEDADLSESYARQQMENLQQAVRADEEVYAMLERMDYPITPAYLEAWSAYMGDRNGMMRQLAKHINDRKPFSEITANLDFAGESIEGLLHDTMEDIMDAFGEACKTPEEMAEAQEKLAETAENVMKNMLVEKEVGTIDLRGMKIAVRQLMMVGQQARKTEQYAVPILVADEYGNISLKIVRGKEEDKGRVDIALDMETTGAVSASFKYEGNSLEGTITSSVEATRQMLSSRMNELAAELQTAAEMPVSLTFGWDENTDANDIHRSQDPGFETTEERRSIQTTKLYGIARAFIHQLNELYS